MSDIKFIHTPKFSEGDMKVEFIGIKDESIEAEARADRIQSLVAQIIALGVKKGRPQKEDTSHEKIAA